EALGDLVVVTADEVPPHGDANVPGKAAQEQDAAPGTADTGKCDLLATGREVGDRVEGERAAVDDDVAVDRCHRVLEGRVQRNGGGSVQQELGTDLRRVVAGGGGHAAEGPHQHVGLGAGEVRDRELLMVLEGWR